MLRLIPQTLKTNVLQDSRLSYLHALLQEAFSLGFPISRSQNCDSAIGPNQPLELKEILVVNNLGVKSSSHNVKAVERYWYDSFQWKSHGNPK